MTGREVTEDYWKTGVISGVKMAENTSENMTSAVEAENPEIRLWDLLYDTARQNKCNINAVQHQLVHMSECVLVANIWKRGTWGCAGYFQVSLMKLFSLWFWKIFTCHICKTAMFGSNRWPKCQHIYLEISQEIQLCVPGFNQAKQKFAAENSPQLSCPCSFSTLSSYLDCLSLIWT